MPLPALFAAALASAAPADCAVEVYVLGTAQDAGWPQTGDNSDPAWEDSELRGRATSIALIDRRDGRRFLFEATPDLREQLHDLDAHAPPIGDGIGLDGIFLTHAHIGHYLGLAQLGIEAASAEDVPVYTLPRFARFLSENGPWSQLVDLGQIRLMPVTEGEPVALGGGIEVTAWCVPHRDEFSGTAGFVIRTLERAALFLPDIDGWDRWEAEHGLRIEDMIDEVDIAYIDATFFDDNEIPGRDMSEIPHPRIVAMIERFSQLGPDQYRKIRFIHLNRTNPAHFRDSAASRTVTEAGFAIARDGDSVCLAARG